MRMPGEAEVGRSMKGGSIRRALDERNRVDGPGERRKEDRWSGKNEW